MTWGYGKVILLGEHAVVYGQPALAGAVDRGVELTARAAASADSPTTLTIPAWKIDTSTQQDHPVAIALRAILEAAGVGANGLVLSGDASVPAAAGLGSSAALAVALARAVSHANTSDARIEEIADAAERCFHGNPSGIDVALASRGGLGLFRRGEGLSPIRAAAVPIVIALSGEPRSTAEMVSRVRRRLEDAPAENQRIEALGELASRGATDLAAGKTERLGSLMSSAHTELAALGVSTPTLETLVQTALEAGAQGAKLTGAGGGGAVIAYGPGRERSICERWTALGYHAFEAHAGAATAGAPSEERP